MTQSFRNVHTNGLWIPLAATTPLAEEKLHGSALDLVQQTWYLIDADEGVGLQWMWLRQWTQDYLMTSLKAKTTLIFDHLLLNKRA